MTATGCKSRRFSDCLRAWVKLAHRLFQGAAISTILPGPRSIYSFGVALVAIAIAGLTAGASAYFAEARELAAWFWTAGTAPVLAALFVEIVTKLRRGEVGLDIVAGLSMTAALAFGEPLAGNVVALMYAGGQQLESFAQGRAQREMTALLTRVPKAAMRYGATGLESVSIDELRVGDRVLVRHGEVVVADGTVADEVAVIDLSALTGEPLPTRHPRGTHVPSGATNVGDPFDLLVAKPASESTYAGIVRLVERAQASRAPIVRMADRYAIWFLLFTVVIAGAAWWITGDRIRALAVLVVATPCPLILAVPVAIISGLSRAASLGVLVKNGGALETLARVTTAILDKTGTLTYGRAAVAEVRTAPGFDADEVLRLAASLDQASNHVMAEALVGAARARGLRLTNPYDVEELAGTGVTGRIEGKRLVVGGSGFVREQSQSGDPRSFRDGLPVGAAIVAVAVDDVVAGIIVLNDDLRSDAQSVLAQLRAAGINRIVLASGDRRDVVASVASQLGVNEFHADLTPALKVQIVDDERSRGLVMMVGDGVNDAPALAAADLGVAMGARGAAASSEAADIVLLVDHLGRLAQAVAVAQRARRIALQSVTVGLGLSICAMGVAALGYLPPVQGAITQEFIDVAVILNALRALHVPTSGTSA